MMQLMTNARHLEVKYTIMKLMYRCVILFYTMYIIFKNLSIIYIYICICIHIYLQAKSSIMKLNVHVCIYIYRYKLWVMNMVTLWH
jgi:hypothetical protein